MVARTFRQIASLLATCGVVVVTLPSISINEPLFVRAPPIISRPAGPSPQLKLRKHDRLRLVEARAQGRREVTLLIASVPGANEKVLLDVTDNGGNLQYRDDDVSYLRVKVPTQSVEKIAQSSDIEALNIDGSVIYVSNVPIQSTEERNGQNRVTPPDANTLAENPYLPSREIGAPQFLSAHPTFDGRGVTVAIVDTNIDPLTPELQSAKTLDGKPTRKLADVLNAVPSAIDPTDDQGKLSSYIKVDMRAEMRTVRSEIFYERVAYKAPAEGHYRIGIFDERMNGNSKGDLNLDGNPLNSTGLFTVLWNEETNTVWVDTNQDHSFADEKAMTDFHVRGDIGIFGKNIPSAPLRKTIGFTVQTDAPHHLIFITPGTAVHGTAVTGAAFGKGFFGGQLNGVAPEAQIVSVPFVGITHSLIESLILAVKHPQVDIITIEAYYYMALNDGDSTLSHVCDRLVEKYKKPIFSAAGNAGDEVNIVQEGAAASKVITVGSYISRDTSRVNYGVANVRPDNIDLASSRGPSEAGGFKPNILAPSMSLTTTPSFLPSETYNNTYELPPGYSVSGGTSTATPMAAAGAALLISAAKQSGVPYDVDRLRWAITSSAHYLPQYGAYEQGNGLFQIGAAWEAFKHAKAPVEITSCSSIRTVLSQYLKDPNQGSGIYEREGWTVGQPGKRAITFTRTTGTRNPTTYSLRWLGNDGTFSSPTTIVLPLGHPVELSVTIEPKTLGVHSAILSLDEIGGANAICQVMNTVVAAEEFTKARRFRIIHTGTAKWMDSSSYFFYVPVETPALNVSLNISKGNARLLLVRPSGDSYYKLTTYSADPCNYQTGGACSQAVVNPETGVWQVVIDNKNSKGESRFATENQATFTMNATLLGVQASRAAITVDSAMTGSSYVNSFEFTNYRASFNGGVMAAPLGSGLRAHPTLSENGEPRVYEVNVTPGTESLTALIGKASEVAADLDLYLFDCTAGECVLKDFSQRDRSEEQVEVQHPSPGKWKVVVDPFFVPAGETSFDYLDFFTNPTFGEIAPVEKPSSHLAESSWVQSVSIRVEAIPTGSRYLGGFLTLRLSVIPESGDSQLAGNSNQSLYANEIVLKQTMIKVGNAAALVSTR